jgi:hypothetical protein
MDLRSNRSLSHKLELKLYVGLQWVQTAKARQRLNQPNVWTTPKYFMIDDHIEGDTIDEFLLREGCSAEIFGYERMVNTEGSVQDQAGQLEHLPFRPDEWF